MLNILYHPKFRSIGRLAKTCFMVVFATLSAFASTDSVSSQPTTASSIDAYKTTLKYVIRFFPLYPTHMQSRLGFGPNHLVGPDMMGPEFGIGVAPNDDTVYVGSGIVLSHEPQILTIPETTVIYSLELYDPYGAVLELNIPKQTPGIYGFVGPEWRGELPAGVERVRVPIDIATFAARADRYSSSGQDQTEAANQFRSSMRLASLSKYEKDPSTGQAQILPVELFSPQMKPLLDYMLRSQPTASSKLKCNTAGFVTVLAWDRNISS